MISMVTNASANDAERLSVVVPHWISVLGARLAELTIVLDTRPPEGRIAALHGTSGGASFDEKLAQVRELIWSLSAKDERIALSTIPEGPARVALTQKWFGTTHSNIDRCQAGTPILAFVAAFDATDAPVVLRADCDMMFHDAGWIDEAAQKLRDGKLDLIEPARSGGEPAHSEVSTRVLMLAPKRFADILPIVPARLDFLRRVHRWGQGRPPWLALEQMLEASRRQAKLRYEMLPERLGCTLHIAKREDAALAVMPTVRSAMESGLIPDAQRRHGHNFSREAWFPKD